MEKKSQPLPSKDELRMNMAALQRIDPFIVQIIQSASQVALYKFIDNEWEKTAIEGTMFVYERNCEPRYGFLILNRRSANNWIQPVAADIDLQLQPPFLLYKTKEGEIFGIWFYEERDCVLVSHSLTILVNKCEKSSRNGAGVGVGSTDLATLLLKAQNPNSNVDKRGPTKSKPSPSGGEKLLRLLSREVESTENSNNDTRHALASSATAPSSGSVAAFFAQATRQEQNQFGGFAIGGPPVPQAMIPGFIPPHQQVGIFPFPNQIPEMQQLHQQQLQHHQQQHEAAADVESQRMLQNLLSNPGVVSVESLERAHREESRTPPTEMPPMPLQATKADDLEADLKNKLQINTPKGAASGGAGRGGKRTHSTSSGQKFEKSPQQQQRHAQHQGKQQQQHQQAPQRQSNPVSYASAVASGEPDHTPKPSAPPKAPPAEPAATSASVTSFFARGSAAINEALESDPPVQLLSPMVFASLDAAPPTSVAAMPVETFVHQPNFQVNGNFNHGHVEPLTKGQFVQALVHLLRTDDQFVGKLHQAYVETLNTKLH